MRRLIAVTLLAAMTLGSGLAGAAPKSDKAKGSGSGGATTTSTTNGPGPNGHNDFGLCKAYFAGSANGQAHKRKAGPFAALEAAADDGNDETSPAEDVAAFCADVTPGGK